MKVFISWSGARSKELANALRQWLPMVLQYVEPWVSDKDISAGERWAQAIAGELEASNFGIICITPENFNSEWILFESGALSKSMMDGKVIPLLFGLELSDLSGPLSQFQAQKIDQAGVMEVVKSINKVAEKPASHDIVDRVVPSLWPQLQETLSKISPSPPNGKNKRSSQEVLEELVTGVRGLSSQMRGLDPDLSERDRNYRGRRWKFRPDVVGEIILTYEDFESSSVLLLMIAGVLREDQPWLAEIFVETYRELNHTALPQIKLKFERLRRIIKHTTTHPILRDAISGSKENVMFLRDLPMLVDIVMNRIIETNSRQKPLDFLEG